MVEAPGQLMVDSTIETMRLRRRIGAGILLVDVVLVYVIVKWVLHF